MDDSETQPVFPVPNVVLFPETLLALHVFEPRYRLMMDEVLKGSQSICMALLRPGWENDYNGVPEVHRVGCVETVVRHHVPPDGRYNPTLHGQYTATLGQSRELLAMFRCSNEGQGAALDRARHMFSPDRRQN